MYYDPQEGTSRHVTISQAKFCADGCDKPYKDYQWMIPITIATKKNQSAHSFLLDVKEATVTIDDVGPSDWVTVCNYDNRWVKFINSGQIFCFDCAVLV